MDYKTNYGIACFGKYNNKLHLVSQIANSNGMALDRTRSICGVEARSKVIINDNWYSNYREACKMFARYYKGEACLNCMRYAKYYLTKTNQFGGSYCQ